MPMYIKTIHEEADLIEVNKMYKKVIKANESRTLLRYSITFHYDLMSLSSSDAKQKITV